MTIEEGRGAATCGLHRFADAEAWERFSKDSRGKLHPCPWCRAEKAEAEVARLKRAQWDPATWTLLPCQRSNGIELCVCCTANEKRSTSAIPTPDE